MPQNHSTPPEGYENLHQYPRNLSQQAVPNYGQQQLLEQQQQCQPDQSQMDLDMGDSPQQTKADTAERDSALTQGLRSLALGSQPQMQSASAAIAQPYVPEEYYTSDQDYMTSEWYGTDEEYEERLSRTVRDIGRFAKLTLSAPEVPVNLPANNVIGALKDYPDVWEEWQQILPIVEKAQEVHSKYNLIAEGGRKWLRDYIGNGNHSMGEQ